jgi:predicted HAD superfamily hydrolase
MYSFDVFDTIIARKTATPQGIFAIMQSELILYPDFSNLHEYIKTNFYELRIHAENLARLNNESNGIEEVSLEDIYQAMAMTGCLSTSEQSILCDLERKTEIDNAIGIKENIIKLKQLISRGEDVVLISDMYLDKKTVRTILVNTDEVFRDLPLYLSSEYCQRKTSGNLYRLIHKVINIAYSDWTHYGDNLHQDIEVPMSLGIKVSHYQPERLTVFEENLLFHHGNNHQLQRCIGVAKYTRRSKQLSTTAGKIGCSLSGPIIYSYVEWILSEAKRKGIRRIYFIARDGYLIKRIADMLIQINNLDISTFYIFGSRKAWRLPSLSKDHFDLYTIIKWSNTRKIKSVEKLAELLMIPLEELRLFLPMGCDDRNVKISNQGLQYIVKKLERNEQFQDYYVNKLKDIHETAINYLKQEIDVSDDSFAFVDVSGGGLTQACLANLMKDFYVKPIHTFFFKIDRVNLASNSINDTFLPSYLENNLVIEMICRAPHGQTIGYEINQGKVVPKMEILEDEACLIHGFIEYQNGIESYAEMMAGFYKMGSIPLLSIEILLKYFNYIAKNPDTETLEYFASFPNSETGQDKKLIEYAPKLIKDDIYNIFLRKTYEYLDEYYEGTNFEYSLLRCNKEEAEYVEYCKREYSTTIGKLARQDKILADENLMRMYGNAGRFPCEILEEYIVIYGAGKFGQGLYRKINDMNINHKIQWVDKDYKKYNQLDLLLVEDPKSIGTRRYDQLIIAVLDKELAGSIKEELKVQGIPEDKIIWMSTNPYEQYYIQW